MSIVILVVLIGALFPVQGSSQTSVKRFTRSFYLSINKGRVGLLHLDLTHFGELPPTREDPGKRAAAFEVTFRRRVPVLHTFIQCFRRSCSNMFEHDVRKVFSYIVV
jgi:hypothetical protein